MARTSTHIIQILIAIPVLLVIMALPTVTSAVQGAGLVGLVLGMYGATGLVIACVLIGAFIQAAKQRESGPKLY